MNAARREFAKNVAWLVGTLLAILLCIAVPAQLFLWLLEYYYTHAHTPATWRFAFIGGLLAGIIGIHIIYVHLVNYIADYWMRVEDYFETIHYPRGDET